MAPRTRSAYLLHPDGGSGAVSPVARTASAGDRGGRRGVGLHVSVCFAPDSRRRADHHALDLLLAPPGGAVEDGAAAGGAGARGRHDALTGLPNRRTFEPKLRRRVAFRTAWARFTLAMIDLDHFKLVNDSFGHPEGDTVLRRSGEAIRGVLRGSDRVFRVAARSRADPGNGRSGRRHGAARTRPRGGQALGVEPTVGSRLSASNRRALESPRHDAVASGAARTDARRARGAYTRRRLRC